MYTQIKSTKELEKLVDKSQDFISFYGLTFKAFQVDGIEHVGIKKNSVYLIFKWDVPANITREMFEQQEFSERKFYAEHFKEFIIGQDIFNI